MIVVASTNGVVGIEAATGVLMGGGSAVDAVEAGIRLVETNADDHSVGIGGYPNFVGDVELDAGIMDGRTRAAGAIGAMQGFPNAISVARRVMDVLPHVFLVGRGAERFATEMGFARMDLLTEEARELWKQRIVQDIPEVKLDQIPALEDLSNRVKIATDPERAKGTVNFLAQDKQGNVCAGVSTSGWAWKYPSRLGDSPVVGAGFYADNRTGAIACTGMGEMAIRAGTARSVMLWIEMGYSLEGACNRAMQDLDSLGGEFLSSMSFIAIDNQGRHAGFSNVKGRSYIFQTETMDCPSEVPRTFVPTKQMWAGR
jgi:beta-aspartyl-peptidase (threonine type)